ncbi:hypothetical protein ACFLIM_02385 [Nonomuraea sp. M3C6]|uniref:Serine/threonine protein kinase n=1 Tax=Nonomuraea marmarensis TaxID=3351344 RepID=A0ABW7A3Y0_9ACTN
MMYGPPPDYPRAPEYPRATSSPTIILLVSGLAALLGFLLGVFVGFGAGTTSEPAAPRVTVTVEETETAEPEATAPTQTAPTQTAPPATTSQPTAPPAQTGQPLPSQTAPGQTQGASTTPAVNPASLRTLVVGTDIQPGTYRTTGPTAGNSMCFWARLRGATGGVIATGMPTGPATVTIGPSDKEFQTGGCAQWTRA